MELTTKKANISETSELKSAIDPNIQVQEFNATVSFGPCEVGKVFYKIFQIRNESKHSLTYTVKRDPKLNPIYQVFDFKNYDSFIAPGSYLQVKVEFKPNLPNHKYTDKIQVIDNTANFYQIFLTGESLAPRITASIRTLRFFITKQEVQKKRTFEIKNYSSVPATYQFEINEDETPFRLDHTHGMLEPYKYRYVTVRFNPKEFRDYMIHLYLLVSYQEPIVIELYGVYDLDYVVSSSEVNYLYAEGVINPSGYFNYLADCIKIRNTIPPISLSETYLNFEYVEEKSTRTLTTCLTNHMKVRTRVIWDNMDDTFNITPREIELPPCESVLFECSFAPMVPEEFFSKTLRCQVYWTDTRKFIDEELPKRIICVPMTLSLRLLGHSFPADKRWIPLVRITPQIIVLPPTMPKIASYGNFIINCEGFLPVSFKFIPPLNTNFVLKPMIGLITSYQIVTVQLHPDDAESNAYIEFWEVMINERKETRIPFYIKCYSGLAFSSFTVGIENEVQFGCIRVGCQESYAVPIQNDSDYKLRYSFAAERNDILTFEEPCGIIPSNGYLKSIWWLEGLSNQPSEIIVTCKLECMNSEEAIMGESIYKEIVVKSCSDESLLVSTPSEEDFGEIKFAANITSKFFIFNFGVAPIHYKMLCYLDDELQFNITVSPDEGTTRPNEGEHIFVNLNGQTDGTHELNVRYKFRRHETSKELLPNLECSLFTLTFSIKYPTIKIMDINYHDYGINFSKIELWKSLSIDDLNYVLENIKEKETKVVQCIIPAYQVGFLGAQIVLLAKNTTQFKTSINFKRIKVCDCKLVAATGLSVRRKVFACKHRDIFEIVDKELEFPQYCTKILKMKIKYTMPSSNILAYRLSLSDERQIEWYFYINIMPLVDTIPSTYTLQLIANFKPVDLRRKNPPVQTFRFYNDTDADVSYYLDTRPFKDIKSIYNYEIFHCLNDRYIIPGFENFPLLLIFCPLELDSIAVQTVLMMGTQPKQLVVQGKGCSKSEVCTEEIPSQISLLPYNYNKEAKVVLSTDEISVDILAWSSSRRTVFIRNLSDNRIMRYHWIDKKVPGVLYAKVLNSRGVLLPRKSQLILIHVESFDLACDLHINLVCKLLDHTQRYLHVKSMHNYMLKEKELEGQFDITEFGTTYPTNDVVIEPNATFEYISIELRVKISTAMDRDICLPVPVQYSQSPQVVLNLNNERLYAPFISFATQSEIQIHSYLGDVIRTQDKFPLGYKLDFFDTSAKYASCFQKYKIIFETILLDSLKSELFHDMMLKLYKQPSPFYIQMILKSKDLAIICPHAISEHFNRKKIAVVCKHVLMRNFIERLQPRQCADVLNEFLINAINKEFDLGEIYPVAISSDQDITKYIKKYLCGCSEV